MTESEYLRRPRIPRDRARDFRSTPPPGQHGGALLWVLALMAVAMGSITLQFDIIGRTHENDQTSEKSTYARRALMQATAKVRTLVKTGALTRVCDPAGKNAVAKARLALRDPYAEGEDWKLDAARQTVRVTTCDLRALPDDALARMADDGAHALRECPPFAVAVRVTDAGSCRGGQLDSAADLQVTVSADDGSDPGSVRAPRRPRFPGFTSLAARNIAPPWGSALTATLRSVEAPQEDRRCAEFCHRQGSGHAWDGDGWRRAKAAGAADGR